jgi:outer membrane lipopolysaccharide assembly protein LptE/RlpB
MTYPEKVSRAQVMVAGLNSNAEQVARRGITAEFIRDLDTHTAEAIALNSEQEKLKADLKSKTAQLEAKLSEVTRAMSEAKKIVKLDFPKDRWKEFGITDKA